MLAKFVVRRFLASIVVVLGVTLITLILMDRTRGTYVPGIDLNAVYEQNTVPQLPQVKEAMRAVATEEA